MKKRLLRKISWILLGATVIFWVLALSIISAFYVNFDSIICCVIWYISDLIILKFCIEKTDEISSVLF